jgi:acyl-CoA thioester hydrolase
MLREMDIDIRVRYQETDAMGFLHHGNFFTYFEMGRTELLRQTGKSYRQLEDEGTLMVVVSIGCKYRRPARYDDLLKLRTKTVRVTPAKIIHTYQVFRGEELLAEGDSVLACVDRDGRVRRTPEWLRFDDEDAA